MRNLRRRIEHKVRAIIFPISDRSMGLERILVDMISDKLFFSNMISFFEPFFDIAEMMVNMSVDVIFIPLMKLRGSFFFGLNRIKHGRKLFVFYFNKA